MLSPIKESPLRELRSEYEEDIDSYDDDDALLPSDSLRMRGKTMTISSDRGLGLIPLELETVPEESNMLYQTDEPDRPMTTAVTNRPLSFSLAGPVLTTTTALSSEASRLHQESSPVLLDSIVIGRNLCDEEHPDPLECLCNVLRMPRVPMARKHYLIYRSPKDGRIYTLGPHWAGLVFTILLVCIASSLFIRNVCIPLGLGYVAIASIYTTLTLLTLLRTACLDPGFITRSAPESLAHRRYCNVCKLYTPPAAGHCEACGLCIEGLDHHCPWTGHCIGRRNMGAFLCFNCIWLTYVLFVVGCLALQALKGPVAADAAEG